MDPAQSQSNQELAQILLQQQLLAGQSGGSYDPLANSLQGPTHPVYSIGQGLADVAGKTIGAYLQRKNYEKLIGLANQNATQVANAEQMARNTGLARDMGSGQLMNIQGNTASTMNPTPANPAMVPNSSLAGAAQMQYAPNVSLPSDLAAANPLSPQERATEALKTLNGPLALKYGDQIQQAATQAQPTPPVATVLNPGQKIILRNPITGQPISGPAGEISGGPMLGQTEVAKANEDFANGRISAKQRDQIIEHANYIAPQPPVQVADPNSPTGNSYVPYWRAIGKPGPRGTAPAAPQQEQELRQQFIGLTSPYLETKDAASRADKLAQAATPQGDVGLMFTYMKVLDPTIRVNEGSAATIEDAKNVPTAIIARYNKLLAGTTFTPEERQDLRGRIDDVLTAQTQNYNQIKKTYTAIAKRNGLNPDNVIRDLTDSASLPTLPDGSPDYSKYTNQQLIDAASRKNAQ